MSIPEEIRRCAWSNSIVEFHSYHDNEWGRPVADGFRLFEKLSLESFQSGLSWRTVLNKRENFRKAFNNFDFQKIAQYTELDVERLLLDEGIIRHRGKIEAVINNARKAQDVFGDKRSFAAFIWSYEPQNMEHQEPQSVSISPSSILLSQDLKKLGWKFVGPTTVFAFMQAMGLVNDHSFDCTFRTKIDHEQQLFTRPVGKRDGSE
ncbi:MAG: DNA-3-methyladenine glycosylase I [Mycobacteriaceae bacterium]